jgi:hypothetical protein
MKPEDQCDFVESLSDPRFVALSQSMAKKKPPFWILSHESGGKYGHIEGGSLSEVAAGWMLWRKANPIPVFAVPQPKEEIPF